MKGDNYQEDKEKGFQETFSMHSVFSLIWFLPLRADFLTPIFTDTKSAEIFPNHAVQTISTSLSS